MARSYIDEADNPRRSSDPEQFKFDFDEHHLVLMALAFLTSNANATYRLKTKLLEFLERIDERLYDSNQDLVWRIALARGVGRAVLKGKAKTLPAVEARVLEDTEWADYHASFFDAYRNDTGHVADGYVNGNELSDEDLQYIDSYVSTRLRFSYLWASRNFFREMVDRVDAGDMGDIAVFNDRVMTVLERVVQAGRQNKAATANEAQDFETGSTSFEAAVRATHAARNKPQSTVRTGMRMFNEMLGGGYEGSRVYVHFGRSGDWKSGMLCSVAFWATDSRFNPEYITKDPTRKPAVLFLTQENDLFDTIERMISFGLGSNVDLRGADIEQIVRLMERAFSSETCRFVFKYRPSRTITTADMEAMIHDEYMKGNEVIMIVQDYIKRIKPMEMYKEARHLELGAVVDEFSMIAKRHNIPVVTGMQLNRGAYEKFELAVQNGDMDAVKKLGASDAGESINVYENADCVIFQGRIPIESTGQMYQTFRRGKMRGKRVSNLDFFAQPFDVDDNGDTNEMRLVEDAHLGQRECRGVLNLGDGIARDYDANAPRQSTSDERRTSRSGAVLSGGNGGGRGGKSSSGPTRRNSGKASANPPPVREDSGAAVLEHERGPAYDPSMEGL